MYPIIRLNRFNKCSTVYHKWKIEKSHLRPCTLVFHNTSIEPLLSLALRCRHDTFCLFVGLRVPCMRAHFKLPLQNWLHGCWRSYWNIFRSLDVRIWIRKPFQKLLGLEHLYVLWCRLSTPSLSPCGKYVNMCYFAHGLGYFSFLSFWSRTVRITQFN